MKPNVKRSHLLALALFLSIHTATAQQPAMRLQYDRPATYFEESLPIGNGKLGALVYGDPDDDIVCLNDITMWTGKPVDPHEGTGAAAWIPKIREALFDEDYARADSLQLHVQGHNSEFYQPLAVLHIIDENTQPVSNYSRQLDLDSALVKIDYRRGDTGYRREYFASNPDKLSAIRIEADRPGGLNCRVVMTSLVPHRVKASTGQLTMTGHATGDAEETIHYCTILRATTDGQSLAGDSTLYVQGATVLTLYVVNETSYNGPNKHPVREGADYIAKAADDAWHTVNNNYAGFRQRHIEDYRHYYDRVKLRLGNGSTANATTDRLLDSYPTAGDDGRYLETLYFQMGRYLLISCSRTPGVPANLQGLWAPQLWSPWRGNYTMNINLEENYWPAFTANLAEMAEPLDDFVKALARNGRHTAKNFYGIEEGWCASHNSDIWAMTNPVGEKRESPMWANWNMGGAWLVNTLWDRYEFTLDDDYLRQTALPLMEGAAAFCINWLVENPKHPGELITAPSTSPENEYVTDKGYQGVTCYGGTADLAIIRELLINTREACMIVAPDSGDGGQRSAMTALAMLHPYTIGSQGDLNEWYYDWNDKDPRHRHQSHLIGLYPGGHISMATTPQLAEACRKTLEMKGNETTGWSTGWRINLWARLHDGERAYQTFRRLLTYVDPEDYQGSDKRHGGGTYANLFDAHPPFQIDGNFGGTAGICEMLVQSSVSHGATDEERRGRIELLPALPEAWSEGEVSGLKARGDVTVDISWSYGRVVKARLQSRKSQLVTVCYNGKEKTVRLKGGKAKVVK